MPTTIVLGAQWGDEGKAKVVDYLTERADVVVRYQGGANAGHTVKVGSDQFVFHLVPSGIMHPDKVCMVGNGVVLDPEAVLAEIDALAARGISCAGRLFISESAHVVMPYHQALDRAGEESVGATRIGTTGRGIGPCYRDKVERTHGIRVMDLLDAEELRQRLPVVVAAKNEILTKIYGQPGLDPQPIIDAYVGYGQRLAQYVADTSVLLSQAIEAGREVLFEGAQGTLLDVDHGTYPFVTSSNTTAGGACTGSGIGPTRIDAVVGVTKAYTTRVGNGPFPTELLGPEGDRLRELGHEYGATTGRPRRCGWIDALPVRRSARINGLTSLAITRLDVLDSLPRLQVCVGYRFGQQTLEEFPANPRVLAACTPVLEELPGWQQPTTGAWRLSDLPAAARRYVERLSSLSRTPVSLVSVGPERAATIDVE